MHKPIRFTDLGLSFRNNLCFADFSGQILPGARIAIIGRNGAGKSTLLKMLQGTWTDYEGSLLLPDELRCGYLPQVMEADRCSGGEALNKALTVALNQDPNLLLLDEPTNHLDKNNRRSLMNHLRQYRGTLIMVTHDVELLRTNADTLWHIHQGRIQVFQGQYEDYQQAQAHKSALLEQEFSGLQQQKKAAHEAMMKEQQRTKQQRLRGEKSIEQRKWPTIRSKTKFGSGVTTGDKRLHQIRDKKEALLQEMALLAPAEIIKPRFHLTAVPHNKTLITITEASLAFPNHPPILQGLSFHLRSGERIALCGDNGSGKTTFIKALLGAEALHKTGDWILPATEIIGYLDQHYHNLDASKSVFDMVASLMPKASQPDIRKHLNDFLFRKNEAVETLIADLSGGEKVRLSLCCIAAAPPALLILDEVTNNLDLETKEHVQQVIADFPGALIVISHEEDFLAGIGIETRYQLQDSRMEVL